MSTNKMIPGTLLHSVMTEHSKKVAQARAKTLEEIMAGNKRMTESMGDLRNVVDKLRGCQQCKDRWMNPHADYVIPPAILDTSKLD